MKREYKLLLIGFLVIGVYDAVGSIASRQFHLNYTILAAISFITYCFFGFLGTKAINIKTGVFIAAAIGLFDSTIGWEISMLLKANTGTIKNDPSIVTWIITIIVVTILAALCGLIGGGLSKALSKTRMVTYNND